MTRNRGNRGGVLKVILIILGAIFVLCLAIGIYVATHWRGWAADVANNAAAAIIKDSGLPPNQQASILTDIRLLGDDFKAGKVSLQEIGQITQTLVEGPLLPLAGVQVAREKYINPSDMTQEEKTDAILTLQRFARGVVEKKISKADVDDVVKPVTNLKPNGQWELKENPTRMEMDEFIASAKAKADAAMIPEEPYELDIAAELHKAIRGT
jgi:hypothetical protein